MEFHIDRDFVSGTIKFRGAVTRCDIERLRLDAADRALLDEAADVADFLLVLEMIFRQYAEPQQESKT